MNFHLRTRMFRQKIIRTASAFREIPFLPRWVILIIDILISIVSFTISYLIYYQLRRDVVSVMPFLMSLSINTFVFLIIFLLFKPYGGIIRYSNFKDAIRVFLTVVCATICTAIIYYMLEKIFHFPGIGSTGSFISFLLTAFLMFSLRIVVKLIHDLAGDEDSSDKKYTPILIYDVSASTVAIAEMIKNNTSTPYCVVGFVSPNKKINDKYILRIPVYSMSEEDRQKIKKKRPQAMLINPIEQGRREKQAIADYCEKNKLTILSFPSVNDWQNGQININKIKNIQIEDLLGRVPITISIEKIGKSLYGKCVMVTGAAGSIGSEIIRQIGRFHPHTILLCDTAETPLHLLQLQLEEKFPLLNFLPLICDVRNYIRMEKIFDIYRPAHVYHAAAYKHVPLMESHPCESIHTNVLGTKNIADLSVKYGTEVFVMVSTDKAVNPTNIMGASKRIAEIYVQSLYEYVKKNAKIKSKIKIITTRFGNVLGSNGSVIPRFKEQIENGGPVTVTHPQITRYFMTIPEACRLVLEAANMGEGGEIFVFDMGTPVKIIDLAEKMIRLAGLRPYEDISIVFSGLRPGEKLYEELLADDEITKPTHNKKIKIGTVRDHYHYIDVKLFVERLRIAVERYEDESIVKIMKELVPEFVSSNSKYEMLDVQK